MRRGIGRLRAAGGGFTPAQLSFTSGLWLDPSDISTGFQDSAGTTPQTATGQPTGKRLDKSGRANHALQATSASRPTYTVAGAISSDACDGVDDGYSTATFVAGGLVNGMDCFIAVKPNSAANMVIASQSPSDGAIFFGVMDATASAAAAGIGAAWTMWVNGVQVGGTANTTRTQLQTAVGSGNWKVFEVRDMDLSLSIQFTIGSYGTLMLNANVGGVILCPAQSSANRANIRTWLGNKVGLSL